MNHQYTIVIYTENIVGLMSRITAVFTRRHINIESLNVCETAKKGVSRFTIVVNVSESMVKTVTKQIRRVVEVIHAEYYEDTQLICSQIGLYKVELSNADRLPALEALAIQNNARILTKTANYVLLENTGNRLTLEAFLKSLQKFGETEYARSGRIAITSHDSIHLNAVLEQLADLNSYPNYKMEHTY